MITDDTTAKAAEQFIQRYGQDAPRQAYVRADELEAKGARPEADLWRRIGQAAEELLR